jgi:hypothetical protein
MITKCARIGNRVGNFTPPEKNDARAVFKTTPAARLRARPKAASTTVLSRRSWPSMSPTLNREGLCYHLAAPGPDITV